MVYSVYTDPHVNSWIIGPLKLESFTKYEIWEQG